MIIRYNIVTPAKLTSHELAQRMYDSYSGYIAGRRAEKRGPMTLSRSYEEIICWEGVWDLNSGIPLWTITPKVYGIGGEPIPKVNEFEIKVEEATKIGTEKAIKKAMAALGGVRT